MNVGEIREGDAPDVAADIDRRLGREIIFCCRKCEANYTVPQKTTECPVCGTRELERKRK